MYVPMYAHIRRDLHGYDASRESGVSSIERGVASLRLPYLSKVTHKSARPDRTIVDRAVRSGRHNNGALVSS